MARLRRDNTGERRTAGLRVQLTPSERAEIDRRAAAVGYSVSDFSRVVLLSDLKAPAPSARDPEAIRAVKVEICRVGNNVNQLAHVANDRGALPSQKALAVISERLWAIYEKVMAL